MAQFMLWGTLLASTTLERAMPTLRPPSDDHDGETTEEYTVEVRLGRRKKNQRRQEAMPRCSGMHRWLRAAGRVLWTVVDATLARWER